MKYRKMIRDLTQQLEKMETKLDNIHKLFEQELKHQEAMLKRENHMIKKISKLEKDMIMRLQTKSIKVKSIVRKDKRHFMTFPQIEKRLGKKLVGSTKTRIYHELENNEEWIAVKGTSFRQTGIIIYLPDGKADTNHGRAGVIFKLCKDQNRPIPIEYIQTVYKDLEKKQINTIFRILIKFFSGYLKRTGVAKTLRWKPRSKQKAIE